MKGENAKVEAARREENTREREGWTRNERPGEGRGGESLEGRDGKRMRR